MALGFLFTSLALAVCLLGTAGAQTCGGAQLPTIYWGGPAELSFPPYDASSVEVENNIKRGADLAFTRANSMPSRLGVLACRNLASLYMDDQANHTLVRQYIDTFVSMSQDQFFGFLVGPDATNSLLTLAYLQNMTASNSSSVFPFVGPWAGSSAYVSPFTRWVFNTAPTNFAGSIYAISDFFAHGLLLSRVALFYPVSDLVSGLDIEGLTSNALNKLGLRLVASYGMTDFNPDVDLITEVVANFSKAAPQAIIMVGASYQAATFILAGKSGMLGPDTLYLLNGVVGPDMGLLLTTPEQRANVYSIDPTPCLNDRTTSLATDFWEDVARFDPTWPTNYTVNYGALLGYLSGRWITQVLETMREPLTRQAFVDAAYLSPIQTVGGITVGPFYDDCSLPVSSCRSCCNVGSRTTYVSQLLDPNTTLALAAADNNTKPSYVYQFAPVTSLTWSGCLPGVGDVASVVKFGQIASLTGASSSSGLAARAGLAYGLEQGSNVISLSYDDLSEPGSNETGESIQELVFTDNVVAMAALYPDALIASFLAVNKSVGGLNVALIGAMSASAGLQEPFVYSTVSIVPSTSVEIAAVMERYVSGQGLTRVGLIYDPDSLTGVDTLDTLKRALLLTADLDLEFVLTSSSTPSSSSSVQVPGGLELLLVHDPTPQLMISIMSAVGVSATGAPQCVVLSAMDPDSVVNAVVSALGSSYLGQLAFTQAVPNPNPTNTSGLPYAELVQQYQAEITTGTVILPSANSTVVPTYLSMHAYLVGAFLVQVVSRINSIVTGEALLAAIYDTGSFNVGGFVLGPFIDGDSSSNAGRNFGSGRIEFVTPRVASSNASSAGARKRSSSSSGNGWSTDHVFTCQSSCVYDFGLTTGQSGGSSLSSWAIALIVLGSAAVCLLVFVAVAASVVPLLLRKGAQESDWEINYDELELGILLGQGGFGEVYKATWKGTEVAVKLMHSLQVGSDAIRSFKDEVAMMSSLRHPNVVLFMAASTRPPKFCIVMEYMALGSLYELIHNDMLPEIPLALKIKLAHQAAKGMHFLHSSGIVHRDLKSLNLLLDAKWNVKVADFGLTKFKSSLKKNDKQFVGSVPWMAPEVLAEEEYVDYALADVYSFGIVLWELFTRAEPYANMKPAQVAVLVIREDVRPPIETDAIDDAELNYVDIMKRCWKRDPSERNTFTEIVKDLESVHSVQTSSSRSLAYTNNSSHTSSSSSAMHSSSYMGGGKKGSSMGEYASTSSDDERLPNARLPRRDVSYAVCDLANVDDMWQSDPSAAEKTIESYSGMVRRHAKAEQGHVFSHSSYNSGGTFMLSFAEPSRAASFALAMLDEAASAAGDKTIGAMSRIGLHYKPGVNKHLKGDQTNTTYDASNYAEACRVAAQCWPGAVLCSSEFSGACGDRLRTRELPDGSCSQLLPGEGTEIEADGQEGDRSHEGNGRRHDTGLCSSNLCPWIINGKNLALEKLIGEGSYGKVSQGTYKGTPVAVKRLYRSRMDEHSMRRMRLEAAILHKISHPNVVSLIGLSISETDVMLVMELVPKGNLAQLLSGSRKLSWNNKLSVLRSAAMGLAFLHQMGIIHRDVKSSNLLVQQDDYGSYSVKVADLGFATAKQDNGTMTRCGTPAWTAPEVLLPRGSADDRSQGQPESVDVYSFGIVMWEVLTRKVPYDQPGANMVNIVKEVLDGRRPPVPADCPPEFASLMKRCWHGKPRKRPSMDDVIVLLNQQTPEGLSV